MAEIAPFEKRGGSERPPPFTHSPHPPFMGFFFPGMACCKRKKPPHPCVRCMFTKHIARLLVYLSNPPSFLPPCVRPGKQSVVLGCVSPFAASGPPPGKLQLWKRKHLLGPGQKHGLVSQQPRLRDTRDPLQPDRWGGEIPNLERQRAESSGNSTLSLGLVDVLYFIPTPTSVVVASSSETCSRSRGPSPPRPLRRLSVPPPERCTRYSYHAICTRIPLAGSDHQFSWFP